MYGIRTGYTARMDPAGSTIDRARGAASYEIANQISTSRPLPDTRLTSFSVQRSSATLNINFVSPTNIVILLGARPWEI